MSLELQVQLQDGSRRTLDMASRSRVSLGRSADNDLAFPEDPVLSRRHVAIELDSGAWVVEDLGSKNGTLLNGTRLNGRHPVRPGDKVVAGRVTLILHDPDADDRTVLFVPDDTAAVNSSEMTRFVNPDDSIEVAMRNPEIAGTNRMQALLEAGRVLDTHRPLGELFHLVLDLAAKTVGARRGVLMTYEKGQLIPRAAKGENFRISQRVRDRVIEEKSSLLITDTAQDDLLRGSMTIVNQRVKSLLATPLVTSEKVIGLLYLDSPDFIRPFTSEDLTFLTFMANIAAVRIENARLVEVEQAERVLSKELEQAADIQRNLLPKSAPAIPGLELAGKSVPCRSVGGDYFDYIKLPDGLTGVIVADVAGKGMSASLLMSNMQARVQMLSEDYRDIADLVARLNRSIVGNCPGNRFITFFMCVLDPRTGEYTYCNAGHNPPFHVKAAGGMDPLSAGGPVLGILKQAGYSSGAGKLAPGDFLALYSDGVTDATAPNGDEYGEDRFCAIIDTLRGRKADEVLLEVFDDMERFMGTTPAPDDITLVVARRS